MQILFDGQIIQPGGEIPSHARHGDDLFANGQWKDRQGQSLFGNGDGVIQLAAYAERSGQRQRVADGSQVLARMVDGLLHAVQPDEQGSVSFGLTG
ncbi:MAG TPA: hypothetical protein VHB98_15775, partial [Chloroflexota bacterium]|nr:hypothetical protein [Chloroflexota bacterium]